MEVRCVMSAEGGGKDIADVLRQLGKAALVTEAENAGLKPNAQGRMRCPFVGCKDKTPSNSVSIYGPNARGVWRVQCFKCDFDGSLVDVLAATRGWTDAQAIQHLYGLPAGPQLRAVEKKPSREARPDAEKRTPDQVRAVWEKCATDDEAGRAYLEGRSLGDAVSAGLVRFATATHPDETLRYWYRDDRLVVALMKDVNGAPRGIQGRLVRALKPGEKAKCISLKQTWNKRAFFGSPERIESSPLVAVAEGLPDFLALAGWTRDQRVVPIGAAGAGSLASLAEELERTDIPVEGRIFALFPQNDAPLNRSRAAFDRLGQLLHRRGARVVMVSTAAEHKDLADWLKAEPELSWPPPQLAAVLDGDAPAEEPGARLMEPVRGGLPIAERVTVAKHEQNLTTLIALLDDPVYREAFTGRRGELSFNRMTGELDFAGHELDETDITGIRMRLESIRAPNDKPLKYSKDEVWDALAYLSKRREVHPIGDWLRSLKWDEADRFEEFARQLGHEPHSLEGMLLRRWCISAAARPLEPGCKVDTVLVLVGDEGLKKSTLFRVLAGPDLFCDTPIQVGDVDGYGVLRRNWIIEWAELESMKRARDRGAVKSFLSSPDDNYRAKFMRGFGRIARSSIIVGTTNDPDFLQGFDNRRFWCVPIDAALVNTRKLMLWLRQNREQLWAQSANVYTAAFNCVECSLERPKDWKPRMDWERCPVHRWHLDDEFATVLRDHNANFREVDEWATLLRKYIADTAPEALTVAAVLAEAIKKPAGQWTRGDQNRAAEALKTLGWAKSGRRFQGEVGVFWKPPRSHGDHT